MKNFKIVKMGNVFKPLEITMYTGTLTTVWVHEEKFNRGEPCRAYEFEELKDDEGKLTIVNNEVMFGVE